MVKVLRSIVRGPLEPHVTGFAEELRGQGYSRSSAEQHVCFIAHLDRWMQAADVGLEQLSGPVVERYLAGRPPNSSTDVEEVRPQGVQQSRERCVGYRGRGRPVGAW